MRTKNITLKVVLKGDAARAWKDGGESIIDTLSDDWGVNQMNIEVYD